MTDEDELILIVIYLCQNPSEVILGAFAKLQKATVSFVWAVCPHGTTGLPLERFS